MGAIRARVVPAQYPLDDGADFLEKDDPFVMLYP